MAWEKECGVGTTVSPKQAVHIFKTVVHQLIIEPCCLIEPSKSLEMNLTRQPPAFYEWIFLLEGRKKLGTVRLLLWA